LRPTDLFTALLISSGAITKQVDRLAAKRLVSRLGDPSHGGGFLIQLTREGLKVVNTATDILASESLLNPIMAKLPAHEREAGEAFSRFVVAELEAMHVMDPVEP
jgi:DNA-binding MarR family transcriptional regulator